MFKVRNKHTGETHVVYGVIEEQGDPMFLIYDKTGYPTWVWVLGLSYEPVI